MAVHGEERDCLGVARVCKDWGEMELENGCLAVREWTVWGKGCSFFVGCVVWWWSELENGEEESGCLAVSGKVEMAVVCE